MYITKYIKTMACTMDLKVFYAKTCYKTKSFNIVQFQHISKQLSDFEVDRELTRS